MLIAGYEHQKACIAEGVIALVLLTGRDIDLDPAGVDTYGGTGRQAFALLGTLIGVFTIAVGVGPRTAPDIAYHIAIVVVLIWGLVITKYT